MQAAEKGGRRGANLALFEAGTLLARGVKEQLVGRRFPVATMRLYTSRNDPDANLSEFAGEAMFVSEPDFDALGPLDIAFFCGTPPEGVRYLDWPRQRGFTAIDLSTAARRDATVPVINAAVNPEKLHGAPNLVATPHPVSLLLSTVLAALQRGCGLESATAVVLQPASEAGDEGINELYRQTVGVLNFQDWPQEIFGRQVAFNVIPAFAWGDRGDPAGSSEARIEEEVRAIAGGRFDLSVAVMVAPVFHCHAAIVRVALPEGKGKSDLGAALSAAPDLRFEAGESTLTPVDLAGKAGIFVAAPRPAGSPRTFWIWAVSDNLKTGAALNAVRIAEELWKDTAEARA
jgi:aspartate-semialdehyde dehydrogenase